MSVLGLKLSTEKSCVSAGPEAVHWKRAVSVLGLKLSTEKSCVSAGPEAVHGKELCQCWA